MKAPILFAVCTAICVAPSAGAQEPVPPQAGGERPFAELPYTPGLDTAAMDRSVDPCADLYQYACGGWKRLNPIPPDKARWSVYGKLYGENQQYLWGILEDASRPDAGRTPEQRQIGDYFAACMDEAAIDEAGATPMAGDLAAVDGLNSAAEIPALLAGIHLRLGGAALFRLGADQDPGNSERVIAWASAGGLGLPDRDYYVKQDERSAQVRERYRAHVADMLERAGGSSASANAQADTVVRIETFLAQASLTRVERRDPARTYHLMPVTDLQALTPSFAWRAYLAAAGLDGVDEINVTEPAFFEALEDRLATEPVVAWRAYLRWHVIRAWAPDLAPKFAEASFAFYAGYLRGVEQMPPRWKRCVSLVDDQLGESLGRVFVERSFPPQVKDATLDMVDRIERVMERRIRALDWMGPETRAQALAKLAGIRNKVGYPDRWRDYSAIEIRRDGFAGNLERARSFESRRQLARIGQPVDHGEWAISPPTVNAFYNPAMNDMTFPAGVLLPPLYDPRLDAAPGYGNTGGTIGHELIHGFDDEGRRFDAHGNLRDWWTAQDAEAFEERVSCVADQYAGYTIVDDIKINSRLTLGEDVADLAGLVLAWEAWKDATRSQPLESRDGLTPEQRFFVGFAQWACENQREEDMRVNALTDPHSPGRYRINGVAANMPEFAEAFACKPGAPLVKPAGEVCRIW